MHILRKDNLSVPSPSIGARHVRPIPYARRASLATCCAVRCPVCTLRHLRPLEPDTLVGYPRAAASLTSPSRGHSALQSVRSRCVARRERARCARSQVHRVRRAGHLVGVGRARRQGVTIRVGVLLLRAGVRMCLVVLVVVRTLIFISQWLDGGAAALSGLIVAGARSGWLGRTALAPPVGTARGLYISYTITVRTLHRSPHSQRADRSARRASPTTSRTRTSWSPSTSF